MSAIEGSANNFVSWFRKHPIWTIILVILAILLLVLLLLFFLPFRVDDASVSNPARNYDEAMTRITAVQQEELAAGNLNPLCISNVMSHGEKVDKVIVFYHGFTSCPEQFRELGEQFFEDGYNVYIPRMPYHGDADQMSEALIDNTAEELAAFATESIDIALGLGDEVVVTGLSGGGTLAAWIAQQHNSVAKSVMIAPFLGIGFIPAFLNRPLTHFLKLLPNIWMWWDPRTKAENPFTQEYQYPRYPLHALAEYLYLGFAAEENAAKTKPGVERLVVITNENDESVNNKIIADFVQKWREHGEESVVTYVFEKALGLPHDVVTPTREDGDISVSYPVIIEAIENN